MSLEILTAAHELRITRLVSHGGMGSVYEALQHGAAGFHKTVAIKTIRKFLAADTEFTRLFIGEAKLVADLVHENIVQVYSLNLSEDGYFIVMEYVEGINLEQFINHHHENQLQVPIELVVGLVDRPTGGQNGRLHDGGG